jgi:hypothetical protein
MPGLSRAVPTFLSLSRRTLSVWRGPSLRHSDHFISPAMGEVDWLTQDAKSCKVILIPAVHGSDGSDFTLQDPDSDTREEELILRSLVWAVDKRSDKLCSDWANAKKPAREKLRVLGHAELFQPFRDLMHCDPRRILRYPVWINKKVYHLRGNSWYPPPKGLHVRPGSCVTSGGALHHETRVF